MTRHSRLHHARWLAAYGGVPLADVLAAGPRQHAVMLTVAQNLLDDRPPRRDRRFLRAWRRHLVAMIREGEL